MTTTVIKHEEGIRLIKTPNQRMQEINIKQGMVFKVYRQQNHPFPDESFVIVIAKTSDARLQAISIETWNRFSDKTYCESATVAEVMQTSKYNYIYFEVMNKIEVIIK
jgi:hypothetical protein